MNCGGLLLVRAVLGDGQGLRADALGEPVRAGRRGQHLPVEALRRLLHDLLPVGEAERDHRVLAAEEAGQRVGAAHAERRARRAAVRVDLVVNRPGHHLVGRVEPDRHLAVRAPVEQLPAGREGEVERRRDGLLQRPGDTVLPVAAQLLRRSSRELLPGPGLLRRRNPDARLLSHLALAIRTRGSWRNGTP